MEALLISQAAHLGDVELANIQIILVLFGFIAFNLDGFAQATEALTGQMVGVFVDAASTLHMRNGMLISFSVFAGLISLLSIGFFHMHYLDGLLFAFILYLIIRGVYLVACLPSIMRLSQASSS